MSTGEPAEPVGDVEGETSTPGETSGTPGQPSDKIKKRVITTMLKALLRRVENASLVGGKALELTNCIKSPETRAPAADGSPVGLVMEILPARTLWRRSPTGACRTTRTASVLGESARSSPPPLYHFR